MELNPGICGVCLSETEVVNSEDSRTSFETIFRIFKDQIINLSELESNLEICPMCIYQTNLLESKTDIMEKIFSDEPRKTNICRYCEGNISMLRIQDSSCLKYLDHSERVKHSGTLSICTCCYYVLQAFVSMKKNLVHNLSTSPSSRKGMPHSMNGRESSTRERSRRSSSREKKDETISSSKTKNTGKDSSQDMLEIFEKLNHRNENNNRHSNSNVSSSKEELSESVIEDELVSSTPKRSRRNKKEKLRASTERSITEDVREENSFMNNTASNEVVSTSDDTPKKVKRIKIRIDREMSTSKIDELSSRSLRKRKAIEITDEEHSSSLSARIIRGTDLSNIVQLVPLCNTKFEVDQDIKQDNKFYRYIPFVKILKISNINPDESRDILNIFTKKSNAESSKPSKGITKPTPRIKIKLKKTFKPRKSVVKQEENKIKSLKRKYQSSPSLVEEFQKKKVIVKVARIKIPLEEVDGSEETDQVESEVTDMKENTPIKKKKRVHFNDTPTIIITGDDFSDLDSLIEDDEFPKKRIARIGQTPNYKVVQNPEPEKVENDDVNIESNNVKLGSDDESGEEDIKKNEESPLKNDTNEIQKTEDETTVHEAALISETTDDSTEESQETEEETLDNEVKKNDKNTEETNIQENLSKSENRYCIEIGDDESSNEHTEKENKTSSDCLEVELDCETRENLENENTEDVESHNSPNDEKYVEENEPTDDLQLLDGCNQEPDKEIINNEIEENTKNSTDGQDKIGVTDIVESTTDFGSLIDEVQKCLTSSQEFSDDEISSLELHASSEEMEERYEENDSVSNEKEVVLESELSPEKVTERRVSQETDSPQESSLGNTSK
ncbi:hypothetical protein HHI36_010321 [Cryptolaemus montrouzieri]|uniref:Uncharacterized protein n=1 Tax=Cryptolaemus montrouzieri TaxID=559131 RepID=A0ABD2MID2_9CUCU